MVPKTNQELKSISEFAENAEEIIKRLKQNNKTIIITQNEKNMAVLLNFQEYEELVELLEFQKAIVTGKEDIKMGRTTQHSVLLKEAEQWIKE